MFARGAVATALVAVALLLVTPGADAQDQDSAVSDLCLGCICEAASGCDTTTTCDGDVCGLFRITWAYWADSGKPVIANDQPDADGAYARCSTDAQCATRSVRSYMIKYGKDCNGDGVINCDDFAAIHRLGVYNCQGNVDPAYANRYNACRNQG